MKKLNSLKDFVINEDASITSDSSEKTNSPSLFEAPFYMPISRIVNDESKSRNSQNCVKYAIKSVVSFIFFQVSGERRG